MKTRLLLSVLLFSWVLAAALIYLHKDRVQLVKLPPQSLAQWYKPDNKRQVWLHNMFKLRREMQAVQRYADEQNAPLLARWTADLDSNYLKIREMVPEWSGRLDPAAMKTLNELAQAKDFKSVPGALGKLKESCNDCHQQFRVVTATLYRAADFSGMQMTQDQSLAESMQTLNADVNDIKISMRAGAMQEAKLSLDALRGGIDQLGAICANCHKGSLKVYPNEPIKNALNTLQTSLSEGDLKQQGRALGELAVGACAQCHGTHRLAYDAKKLLGSSPGWLELLRH